MPRHLLPIAFILSIYCISLVTPQVAAQGGHSHICQRIQQDYAVQKSRLNARQLNFFLFDAAKAGCDDLLTLLLGEGASTKARDRNGNTAFLLAAQAGKRTTIKTLIGSGADIHYRNLSGANALLLAAVTNRMGTVKLLIKEGLDIDNSTRRGVTPLMAAAFNGNARMTEALLAAGAKPGATDATGKSAMIYAAARGFSKVVALLLDAGADVNQRGGNNLTPLMWAAGHSNDVPKGEAVATINLLIKRGADLDLIDNRGQSALMTAARQNHLTLYELLLAAGADPALKDKEGLTANDWLQKARTDKG